MRERDGWEGGIVEIATRGGRTYFEGRGRYSGKQRQDGRSMLIRACRRNRQFYLGVETSCGHRGSLVM